MIQRPSSSCTTSGLEPLRHKRGRHLLCRHTTVMQMSSFDEMGLELVFLVGGVTDEVCHLNVFAGKLPKTVEYFCKHLKIHP